MDLTEDDEDDCEEEKDEKAHNSLDKDQPSTSSPSSSSSVKDPSYHNHQKEKRRQANQLLAEQAELEALAEQEPMPLTVSGFKNNLFYVLEKDLRGDQG
jgi:hypothetical protein